MDKEKHKALVTLFWRSTGVCVVAAFFGIGFEREYGMSYFSEFLKMTGVASFTLSAIVGVMLYGARNSK